MGLRRWRRERLFITGSLCNGGRGGGRERRGEGRGRRRRRAAMAPEEQPPPVPFPRARRVVRGGRAPGGETGALPAGDSWRGETWSLKCPLSKLAPSSPADGSRSDPRSAESSPRAGGGRGGRRARRPHAAPHPPLSKGGGRRAGGPRCAGRGRTGKSRRFPSPPPRSCRLHAAAAASGTV